MYNIIVRRIIFLVYPEVVLLLLLAAYYSFVGLMKLTVNCYLDSIDWMFLVMIILQPIL